MQRIAYGGYFRDNDSLEPAGRSAERAEIRGIGLAEEGDIPEPQFCKLHNVLTIIKLCIEDSYRVLWYCFGQAFPAGYLLRA